MLFMIQQPTQHHPMDIFACTKKKVRDPLVDMAMGLFDSNSNKSRAISWANHWFWLRWRQGIAIDVHGYEIKSNTAKKRKQMVNLEKEKKYYKNKYDDWRRSAASFC